MRSSLRIIRHPAPSTVDPVAHELILTAIHERRLVRFSYKNKIRLAEPHDYGIYKGTVRLLAFQLSGPSRGPLPGWRWIDVDRISKPELLDKTFAGGRRVSGNHHTWEVIFARVDPSSHPNT
jgi:hypothetical protein